MGNPRGGAPPNPGNTTPQKRHTGGAGVGGPKSPRGPPEFGPPNSFWADFATRAAQSLEIWNFGYSGIECVSVVLLPLSPPFPWIRGTGSGGLWWF